MDGDNQGSVSLDYVNETMKANFNQSGLAKLANLTAHRQGGRSAADSKTRVQFASKPPQKPYKIVAQDAGKSQAGQ